MAGLPYEELERLFKTLANVNRLRLLVALQEPRGYGEIELPPSRTDSRGTDDRSISRPAVRRHVQRLMEVGVVKRHLPSPEAAGGGQPKRFIVDHARLFALLQQAMTLATVRPTVQAEEDTMALDTPGQPAPVPGPHLSLVRGVREGQRFPLDGPEHSWLIGRRPPAEIELDYDAYVSSEHARIQRKDETFVLVDLPQNRNGTLVNWRPIKPGAPVPLSPGDVIGIGMSLLVFQDGG